VNLKCIIFFPIPSVNGCHLDLHAPYSNCDKRQSLTNGKILPICFSAAYAHPDNDMVNLKGIANCPHFACRGVVGGAGGVPPLKRWLAPLKDLSDITLLKGGK